jgi:hypothetical protein
MYQERVEVRPRFRCLVCRRFVEGTDQGTCPRCAWQPPRTAVGERPRRAPRMAVLVGLLAILVAILGWASTGSG